MPDFAEREIQRILKEDGALLVRANKGKEIWRLSSGKQFIYYPHTGGPHNKKNALAMLKRYLGKPSKGDSQADFGLAPAVPDTTMAQAFKEAGVNTYVSSDRKPVGFEPRGNVALLDTPDPEPSNDFGNTVAYDEATPVEATDTEPMMIGGGGPTPTSPAPAEQPVAVRTPNPKVALDQMREQLAIESHADIKLERSVDKPTKPHSPVNNFTPSEIEVVNEARKTGGEAAANKVIAAIHEGKLVVPDKPALYFTIRDRAHSYRSIYKLKMDEADELQRKVDRLIEEADQCRAQAEKMEGALKILDAQPTLLDAILEVLNIANLDVPAKAAKPAPAKPAPAKPAPAKPAPVVTAPAPVNQEGVPKGHRDYAIEAFQKTKWKQAATRRLYAKVLELHPELQGKLNFDSFSQALYQGAQAGKGIRKVDRGVFTLIGGDNAQ